MSYEKMNLQNTWPHWDILTDASLHAIVININVSGQVEKEDYEGVDLNNTCQKTQNVLLYRVERSQDSLQKIRKPLLLRSYRCKFTEIIQVQSEDIFFQSTDNELITLEIIHRYVELLDKYFGSVSHILGYIVEFTIL